MSLFTDLKEILTPYAQRIKGLAAIDNEIKADLNSLDESLDAVEKASSNAISHRILQDVSQSEQALARENIGISDIDYQMFLNALIDCLSVVVTDTYEGANRFMVLQNSLENIGLPRDYIKLNYIQSNGNLAIDTGIIPTFSMSFRAIFMEHAMIRPNTMDEKNTMGPVISAGAGGKTRYFPCAVLSDSDTRKYPVAGCRFGSTAWQNIVRFNKFETLVDQSVNMSVSNNVLQLEYTINGEEYSVTADMANITLPSNSLYIFFNPESGFDMTKMDYWTRVYRVIISDNNNVLFDGIPCCYIPDGVCGLYNLADDTFYPLVDYSSYNS